MHQGERKRRRFHDSEGCGNAQRQRWSRREEIETQNYCLCTHPSYPTEPVPPPPPPVSVVRSYCFCIRFHLAIRIMPYFPLNCGIYTMYVVFSFTVFAGLAVVATFWCVISVLGTWLWCNTAVYFFFPFYFFLFVWWRCVIFLGPLHSVVCMFLKCACFGQVRFLRVPVDCVCCTVILGS